MKKVLAFLAALTLVVSVTACGDKIRQENQNSDTQLENSSDQTGSQTTDNSDTGNSEPEPEQPGWHRSDEEGFKEMIEIFDMDDIKAPNGEKLKKADASYLYGSSEYVVCAGYDFSYMRKVKPYFRSILDEPNMMNWDTLEIADLPEILFEPEYEYIKIKQGDVLENGLKVKTAQTAFGYAGGDGLLSDLKVELEGELTLEGVLRCTPEDEYVIGKGELIFFPDYTKHTDMFIAYQERFIEPVSYIDPATKFAVAANGLEISLGMVDKAPSGVSDMFEHDTFIKAKVTISDINFKTRPGGVRAFATVKSVEQL